MAEVFVVGVGITPFGRHTERSVADLAAQATTAALADAGLADAAVEAVQLGSCALHAWGQRNVAGPVLCAQLAKNHPELAGLAGLPVATVEAGCATGGLALAAAANQLRAGAADVVLVLGADKTFLPGDPSAVLALLEGAMDQLDAEAREAHLAAVAEADGQTWAPHPHRVRLIDVAALQARHYQRARGLSDTQFGALLAGAAAAGHQAGALNPNAQHQRALSAEQVLADKPVHAPFTRAMCAPISDGAAAVLLVSAAGLARCSPEVRARAVRLGEVVVAGGRQRGLAEASVTERAGRALWARTGLRPADIDLAELHDATAFARVAALEGLGFAAAGEGALLVNRSGGLVAKGHPLAASGLAMVHELVTQLRGEAGARQVARRGPALFHNAGGLVGVDEAVCVVGVLTPQ